MILAGALRCSVATYPITMLAYYRPRPTANL
jgi:hypothetical protein